MRDDQFERVERLRKLAKVMDAAVPVPVIGGVGLDGILGLIPGVGDAATGAISLYLVAEAMAAGARKRIIAQMLFNALVDTVLGAVPVLGDLFDFAFKANVRNINLLIEEIERGEIG
jgi:hypothetical protein